MNFLEKLFSAFLLAGIVVLGGCDSGNSESSKLPPPENNVLKEYINKPKAQANAAKEAVERSQRKVDETLNELDDE